MPHRPRSTSILGLLAELARLRRGLTAAILVGAGVALALAARAPADDPCRLVGTTWSAGVDRYDHLQSIDFSSDGRGAMVYGYGQAVRLDLRFRWRELADGRIELYQFVDVETGDTVAGRRRARPRLTRGDYRFVQPTPGGERPVRFRCRLRLSASPFPGGDPPDRDYYGVPLPCR